MATVERNTRQEPIRNPGDTAFEERRYDERRRGNGTHATPARTTDTSLEVVSGGSSLAGIAGAGAATLAILGLAGVLPVWLLSISVIAAGAALFFEGASLSARYSDLISGHRTRAEEVEFGGGMTAQTVAGLGGVALGILALLGVSTAILNPVAAIVLGGGLFFGASATARLDNLIARQSARSPTGEKIAHMAVESAAGGQVLVGLGAGTLGVLALIGYSPLILTLVAMLSVGGVMLLSGAAVGGRVFGAFRHA